MVRKVEVFIISGVLLFFAAVILILYLALANANEALTREQYARTNEALAWELLAESESLRASVPEIPDSENGALPILKALESLEPFPTEDEILESDAPKLKESKERNLWEYFARNEMPLTRIVDSLDYERFTYPVDYRRVNEESWDYLMKIHSAAKVLEAKADLLKLDERNAEAMGEYINAVRLGMTLSSGKTLISHIVASAVFLNTYAKLIPLLSTESLIETDLASALEQLLNLYNQYRERTNLRALLRAELSFQFETLADGINQEHSIDWIRGVRESVSGEQDDFSNPQPAKYIHDFRDDVQALRMLEDLFHRAEEEGYHVVRAELGNLLAARFDDGLWIRENGPPIVVDMSGMARCLEKFAFGDVFWHAASVIAAIQLFEIRNGRLPATLDELGELVPERMLLDPFSGKNLVYKPVGSGFCLYSVGKDGIDSNCEDDRELLETWAQEGEPDDIIFHLPTPTRR